jgi:tRNA (guanosine-2'-O-)-methyltransferase
MSDLFLSSAGKNIPPQKIIETLSPLLTPERLAKINLVASQRLPQVSVLLEDIYDRGNASAVMRSAEAFGFYQFDMIERQDNFKESKRVTQGAHKWLQIQKWDSTLECVKHLKSQGRKIYVTHLDPEALPLHEVPVHEPLAICFGNEKDGATKELIDLADQTVFIPMRGFVQSFNISVAAALCFYDLQKRLTPPPVLNPSLVAYYLTQSVDHWERHF